jgi:cytochrome c oxidase subunit III
LSEHTTGLAHHFDDLDQQHRAGSLGMWVFLVTEIMFFGGLFVGYALYRHMYPLAFAEGSHHLDMYVGTFNTIILIGSSVTMVLAVWAAQTGRQKAIIWFLILTILLGGAFLGIKAYEYHHKWVENLIPGQSFHHVGRADSGNVQLFFLFYFAMTGMHALHMIIGVVIIAIVIRMAAQGRFTREHYAPVDITGLYWHFVDIVWIFLFPMLYLIDRHK